MSKMSGEVRKERTLLFATESQTQFQLAMQKGLRTQGWTVETFSWEEYIPKSISGKMQSRYLWGPAIKRINEVLVEACHSRKPDVLLIYKGHPIWPQTLMHLAHYLRLVVSYHPDDPFGNYNADYAQRYRGEKSLPNVILGLEKGFYFRHYASSFIRTIPYYHINFVVRITDIEEYKRAGAREVHFLPRFYVPWLHHPMALTQDDQKRFGSDVVFIGHFEPDHRVECIEALLEAGIRVRLFGTGWDRYLSKKLKESFGPIISPLYGEEYVKALCASKVALCFFSKLNRDTSTIRSFEVPACGSLLMSERTEEMKQLFEEDKEAVYFSDKEELVHKVLLLLQYPERRNAIAMAGYARSLRDGNDVVNRMRTWSDIVSRHLDPK